MKWGDWRILRRSIQRPSCSLYRSQNLPAASPASKARRMLKRTRESCTTCLSLQLPGDDRVPLVAGPQHDFDELADGAAPARVARYPVRAGRHVRRGIGRGRTQADLCDYAQVRKVIAHVGHFIS